MKKVLALVLVAAMLLSCMVVGLSAARVVTAETKTNTYWNFPAGNSYSPIAAGDQGSGFDVKMNIRLDEADSKIGNQYDLTKWPAISTSAIGVAGNTVPCNLEVGTWYSVEWIANDGETTIYVDGAEVGTVGGTITLYENQAYWSWEKVSIDNVVIGSFSDDVEDANIPGCGQGLALEEEVEGARYDLGKLFWTFPAGNSYSPIAAGDQGSAFDVEMDICLDEADSKIGNQYDLTKWPAISTSAIGVAGNTVPCELQVGEWYHITWDAKDGSTDIYVDDVYVGNVAGNITLYENQAYWSWEKVSIDNVVIGSFSDDVEDANIPGCGQGLAVEYVLAETSIFDHVDITAEPAGEALYIESSWDPSATSGYIEVPMPTNNLNNKYIITYDISYVQTKESEETHFEYWTNWNGGTPVRWSVGTTSGGKDADQILFDWGEATLDNFHEVTMVFNTMDAQIYVDGELFYEGKIGLNNSDLSVSLFCMWYGNAIIDNFQLIDGESFEVVYDQSDLPTGTGYNRGSGVMRHVNLDADDFCAENGHSAGWTTMEKDSTCVAEGNYINTCAVCGEFLANYSIEKKAHNWAGYDINRKTEDGLVYTYCKNGGDCTQKYYVELPAADAYTGHIYQYHDFQDDFMNVMESGWGYDNNWVWDNGTFSSKNGVSNYNDHYLPGYVNSNDFSMSWDMAIQGVYADWAGSTDGGYAPEVYAWIGGASGYAFMIGYNVVDEYIFIRPTNEGAFNPLSVDYKMVQGEVYNFSVNFKLNIPTDGGAPSGRLSVFVNGEEVLYTTSRSIVAQQFAKSYTSDENLGFVILRNFHTDMNIDNYTIASSDFAWNRTYNGDVSGDFVLDADDVLLMRKYLAKVTADIVTSRADANGDGDINAKDQLTIRKALAAA